MPWLHNGPVRQLGLNLISSLLPRALLSGLYNRTNWGQIDLGQPLVSEWLLHNQEAPET